MRVFAGMAIVGLALFVWELSAQWGSRRFPARPGDRYGEARQKANARVGPYILAISGAAIVVGVVGLIATWIL